ncbi:MAG TPA: hypothetical protein VKE49_02425 [Myxococcaceae bacterium]|nr:hypothetical protein [Myxococcaceae bacterium]
MTRALVAVLIAGGLCGCRHGELKNGIYSKSGLRYRVGEVPTDWKQLNLRENDLAFVSDDNAHSMAVNATCEGYEDAPLPVLTQHLLMGFTDRQLVHQETRPMDGRESLRSHYIAKLDGVPVELLLVVLKKDGCVYDFTYVSPKGRFEEKLADFERMVDQFKTEGRR